MTTATRTQTKVLQPYIFFDGRCEEAAEFYKQAVGAEILMLMRFKDSPEPPDSDDGCGGATSDPEKVMHMTLKIGETMLLASDGRCEGKPNFEGFALSLNVPSETEAEQVFSRLSEGGEVQMPLSKTFFSPAFGMVADRFGVSWMIHVEA